MGPSSPLLGPIAILVTLALCVMPRSLSARKPKRDFRVFIFHSLYGNWFFLLDALFYNLGEKFYHSCRMRPHSAGKERFDLDWERQNTALIIVPNKKSALF